MAVIVQKFGGSSLCDLDALARVAHRIEATVAQGHQVAVVVSAMGDTTDDLLGLSNQLTPTPDPREQDLLLSTGEVVSMTLLAITLGAAGVPARSFTGTQAGIRTDDTHGYARILEVHPEQLEQSLKAGQVAIVAGFQGIGQHTGQVTTLGRGGSDTTAVALAAALRAEVCEIYTDVDGVYTADPRLVPTATKLAHLSYDHMLELAANGCQVLHDRCVEYARNSHVPLHVRSSYTPDPGTWITHRTSATPNAERTPYSRTVTGIAHDTSRSRLTLHALPVITPQHINTLIRTMTSAGLPVTNLNTHTTNHAAGPHDITLTIADADLPRAIAALTDSHDALDFSTLSSSDKIGTVSLIGTGLRADPTAATQFSQAIHDAGAHTDAIHITDTAITTTTDAATLPGLVRTLHTTFGLDGGCAAGVDSVEVGLALDR